MNIIILGDADGAVVIPQEYAAEVLAKAQGTAVMERQMRECLARGESIYDILKLEGVLRSLGIVEQ